MTSRSGAELPQLELECLAALWALERAPVAQVHARLAERGRRLAYTTVLTVMERLLRKRVVERERRGRAYVYRPLLSRAEMRRRALDRLVANYFDSPQEFERYLRPQPTAAPVRPAPPAPEPDPEPSFID